MLNKYIVGILAISDLPTDEFKPIMYRRDTLYPEFLSELKGKTLGGRMRLAQFNTHSIGEQLFLIKTS